MVTRHSFGGGIDVQSSIGALSILFLSAGFMAYVNIKKLQIEEHRAWMLRAWVYAGSVITTRFILFSGVAIISHIGGYVAAIQCAKIHWMLKNENETLVSYPEYMPFFRDNKDEIALVHATIYGSQPEAAAAYDLTYGTAHWIALGIHVLAIELYLRLTSSEHERLRRISYQRQSEAGML
ncbi:putative Microtubule associated protein [Seiridium cardinale]